MRAIQLYGVDDIRLDEVAEPVCGSNDIVMDVMKCGVCASDYSFSQMGSFFGPDVAMPLGHEFSGVVSEVGASIKDITIGERVVIDPMAGGSNIGCGSPEGAFADKIVIRNAQKNKNVFVLPESMSFAAGALVEPVAVGTHAVNVANPKTKDKVVVLGAGPIGLGAVMALKARGVEQITVVDLSDNRLSLAMTLGASDVFNASQGKTAKHLAEVCGAEENRTVGADVYIDAVGIPDVLNSTIKMAKYGAVIVVVAVYRQEVNMNMVDVLSKQLTIKGSIGYPDEFEQVMNMLATESSNIEKMISHHFSLDQFHEALKMSRNTNQAIKVMIDVSQ